MYEIAVTDYIEAAHWTAVNADEADHRRRMHGHSYVVTLWLFREALDSSGMVEELDALKGELRTICDELDHRVLNDVEALGHPTMEAISKFVYERATTRGLNVKCVEVNRPTLGYTARYYEG